MTVRHEADLPALLGGAPLCAQGPPPWPLWEAEIAEVLHQLAADGGWGRYAGPHCQRLSAGLAEYHGCEQVVLCASGTAAVELALRGVPVGAGDEVILAAYDFKGNFSDVLTVGATPVLVDIDPDNWNLDVRRLSSAVSPATKAILVSHLHGGIVPMPAVMELAQAHGLAVIEDACQMPGAVIHGRRAGRWGDVGVLSFGGSKLLTAGRGGALLSNRGDIVQRVRLYTQRGNEAYPLSEMQAAVLLPQLAQLDARNRRRRASVGRLDEWLAHSGLRRLQNPPSESEPGYYKVGYQFEPRAFGGMSRDLFARAMRAEGIAMDPGLRALHRTHSARRYRAAGELPQASAADDTILTLHHPVLLGSDEDLRQVAAAVERIGRFAEQIVESAGEE